jgi:hypothetical protein
VRGGGIDGSLQSPQPFMNRLNRSESAIFNLGRSLGIPFVFYFNELKKKILPAPLLANGLPIFLHTFFYSVINGTYIPDFSKGVQNSIHIIS